MPGSNELLGDAAARVEPLWPERGEQDGGGSFSTQYVYAKRTKGQTDDA
jgi:hypothetical protein